MSRGLPTATFHNAYIGWLSKVLYPYPLVPREHKVYDAPDGTRDLVYARVTDKSSKGAPAGMFDPDVCANARYQRGSAEPGI